VRFFCERTRMESPGSAGVRKYRDEGGVSLANHVEIAPDPSEVIPTTEPSLNQLASTP